MARERWGSKLGVILAVAGPANGGREFSMTTGGWIFMIVSWAVILTLFAYCMYRTLRSR